MHDQDNDTPRRRAAGPATLSGAIQAQRGLRPNAAPPPPPQHQQPADPFAAGPAHAAPPPPPMHGGPGAMPHGGPELVVHDQTPESNSAAIFGATVAGIVGALVWWGVAALTGYEIGWIAWGVGAGVGAAYHQQGGNPTLGMAVCAIIAVLSIIGGKYLAFNTVVTSELEAMHDSGEMDEMYKWLHANAERYHEADDKLEMSRQMAAEFWYGEDDPNYVDDEEAAEFMADVGPMLQRVHQHDSYESFYRAEIGHIEATASFGDMFDFVDILFFAFGVISAIRLANGESG